MLSFPKIQQNFAPSCIFLLSIIFPPCNVLGTTTSLPEGTAGLLFSDGSVDEKLRLASEKKNCCLLKVLPNRLHPTPQKDLQYPQFFTTEQHELSCRKS